VEEEEGGGGGETKKKYWVKGPKNQTLALNKVRQKCQ